MVLSVGKVVLSVGNYLRGIFRNVLTAKNRLLGGLKTPKIAKKSKNAIFSKCEIMIPQSNLGKRKVKLMLVQP